MYHVTAEQLRNRAKLEIEPERTRFLEKALRFDIAGVDLPSAKRTATFIGRELTPLEIKELHHNSFVDDSIEIMEMRFEIITLFEKGEQEAALANLFGRCLHHGRVALAKKIAEYVGRSLEQNDLEQLRAALVKRGDVGALTIIATEMEQPITYDEAAHVMALLLSRTGVEALQQLLEVLDEALRMEITELALKQMLSSGDAEAALFLAKVRKTPLRIPEYEVLIKALVASEKYNLAKDFLDEIEGDEQIFGCTTLFIISRMLRSERYDAAVELLPRLTGATHLSAATDVMKALLASGYFEAAAHVAQVHLKRELLADEILLVLANRIESGRGELKSVARYAKSILKKS